MLDSILQEYNKTIFDFTEFANPHDPFNYLFGEWRSYYRMKWAIAKVIQPKSILEIGVRYGYSAISFLSACPDAQYVGIDNDTDTIQPEDSTSE